MVSIKDILIELCIVFVWFFGSIIIGALFELPFLLLPFFIAFVSLKLYLKRRKRILDFVKDDFQKLGYQLNSERPTSFNEYFKKTELEVLPVILINDVPLKRYRYMRGFRRIFTARSKNGKLYELNTFVMHKWNGENKIEIINIKNLPN
ncbi:hypothetical protein J2Y38_003083 [Flavobacterium sp. 2755]|uniref:hypothetical protein n=1 Tax=Flavobacterium sp. 2755 TaxID=2817765 RepID=UPI002855A435|nr:hypothetical protein [Flavobacterium sp. 2755]MDR6762865.1 hypothetical protein [Flavobacterium sp. 2755]